MDLAHIQQVEADLLKKLEASGGKDQDALFGLTLIHDNLGRYDQALGCLAQLLPLAANNEDAAYILFCTGQFYEKKRTFVGAEYYYRRAYRLAPQRRDIWYFVHNNLGYSLNQQMRFAEAREFLMRAIEIDPARPNGYKNLGLCYQGLGYYLHAAEMFVSATQVCPADARALRHLEALLNEHAELFAIEPGLGSKVALCQQVVRSAQVRPTPSPSPSNN